MTAISFTACDKGGEETNPTYTVTFDADGGMTWDKNGYDGFAIPLFSRHYKL